MVKGSLGGRSQDRRILGLNPPGPQGSQRIARSQAPQTWLAAWLGGATALVVGVALLTCSRASLRRATVGWLWLPTLLLAVERASIAALAFVDFSRVPGHEYLAQARPLPSPQLSPLWRPEAACSASTRYGIGPFQWGRPSTAPSRVNGCGGMPRGAGPTLQ